MVNVDFYFSYQNGTDESKIVKHLLLAQIELSHLEFK